MGMDDRKQDPAAASVTSGPGGVDWQAAYEANRTPWDLRGPTGPLSALIQDGFFAAAGLQPGDRVAVPMCGRGHDLRQLAACGFRVTGFDIARAAIAEANRLKQLNGFAAELLVRDVLGLCGQAGGRFSGAFELVYDYTGFCALPPHLRGSYVTQLHRIVAPSGHLLMLAFPLLERAAGPRGRPPFLVTESDLERVMGDRFELITSRDAVGSAPDRRGAERWFHYRKATAA